MVDVCAPRTDALIAKKLIRYTQLLKFLIGDILYRLYIELLRSRICKGIGFDIAI